MEYRLDLNSFEIVERMKKICGAYSDKDLADFIGVKPPSLAGWKNRNSVPLEPLLLISNQFNVSIDWLLYGKNKEELSTNEQLVLLAFNALDDKRKLEALAFMTGLK